MIRIDEDALICDLAETYQIYNYRDWPPMKVAIFARGLKEDSRIKMKMSAAKAPTETILLATIADILSLILWSKTEDGMKNRNRPKSILRSLYGTQSDKKVTSFASGKDFEIARNNLLKGG